MNRPWYKLDIDIANAINDNFEFKEPEYITNRKHGVWGFDNTTLTEFFNKEWLEYMKSIDLEVISVLIFYRLPHANTTEAHIDLAYGQKNHPSIAINWTIGIDDGDMVWFNTPSDTVDAPIKVILPDPGHKYSSWEIPKLTEISRHTIGNSPHVVRVDIPHTVEMKNHARWAISVRCKTAAGISEWNDIVNHISPYIVEDNQ